MALYLNKLKSPSPKSALCQVRLKLAQWFCRRFLKFVNIFSLFRYYLSIEKVVALHLNKLESPSPKDALCQVWLKLALWDLRKRYLFIANVFSLFRNYFPLKRAWPFIWKKFNLLHPRMLCANFGWNLPSGSGEEDKNVKSLQRRQRTMNKLYSEMLNWTFGSGELKRYMNIWRTLLNKSKCIHNST